MFRLYRIVSPLYTTLLSQNQIASPIMGGFIESDQLHRFYCDLLTFLP